MKIVSGGQTGVDRAALDVAMALGLSCGGYCPKGRRAEDGRIPDRYPLQETPSPDYAQRTEWNVRDADGTLVLAMGVPTGGTALTIDLARTLRRPLRVVDLNLPADIDSVTAWITSNRIGTLNIAGPRASESPQIYDLAVAALKKLLRGMQ
ncbi:MAG TPA: putative molybdenum carrier protein [Verrucomicrobiae bacterium]|nr:putative molybdenum carrier protein [Verrucomicrobiae bacterium]